jgi:hypothetical protein
VQIILVMKLRTVSPSWFNEDSPEKEAKCIRFPASRDYDPWFGDSDDPDALDETAEAKQICLGTSDGRECPLRQQCLEFAMDNNERYGIFGGKDPEERAQLRKQRRETSKELNG